MPKRSIPERHYASSLANLRQWATHLLGLYSISAAIVEPADARLALAHLHVDLAVASI
jgi:hypothetical protein